SAFQTNGGSKPPPYLEPITFYFFTFHSKNSFCGAILIGHRRSLSLICEANFIFAKAKTSCAEGTLHSSFQKSVIVGAYPNLFSITFSFFIKKQVSPKRADL
ncbi:MAG: hypothetical protein ACI4I3_05785, partial [Acutalibacteraceae bacterium]